MLLRVETCRTQPSVSRRPDRLDEMLELVGRGDVHAFEAFYDHSARRLQGIIHRVVRSTAIAEEVLQEVFVEIWRAASRFDASRGSAMGWSSSIAHRRAVDRVRSEQARRVREGAEDGRDDTVPTCPEGATLAGLRRDELHRALGSLSTGEREAITLAYFGGRTYRQVASELGIPEGTAKTRIRSGLGTLRLTMSEVD